MSNNQSPTRYIIGLVMILVGLGYLFENVLGINFGQILSDWWAIILVIAGVYHIAKQPEKLTSGLIVIAIGGVILADNLFPEIDFWSTFVPILLIIFGIGFLLRDNNKSGVEVKSKFSFNFDNSNPDYLDDEVINVTALFSGAEHHISSKKFRGGKVSSTFGGVELDLRNAEMATGEASIDIDCVFGGVEIKVPQSWRVHVSGSPVMGGISNDTFYSPRSDSTTTEQLLTIRATVMFGGLEISN
jgi:predicted membrane protein